MAQEVRKPLRLFTLQAWGFTQVGIISPILFNLKEAFLYFMRTIELNFDLSAMQATFSKYLLPWRPVLVLIGLICCTGCKTYRMMNQGKLIKTPLDNTIDVFYERGFFFVPVTVNGRTYRFLVDTGAPNVVDDQVARELGLKRAYQTAVSDSQGRSNQLDFVTVDRLAFGGLVWKNIIAAVTDLSIFGCVQFDGIIGTNALVSFDWEFDYESAQLRWFRNTRPVGYSVRIPFSDPGQRSPEFQVQFNGRTFRKVTLDSGSNGGFSLRLDDADQQWLEQFPTTFRYGKSSKGIYGAHTDSIFYLLGEKLKLAKYPIDSVVIRFSRSTNKIGNDFWEQYGKIFISWSDKALYLTSKEQFTPVQLPQSAMGLEWENDTVRIATLFEAASALSADWQIGDVITAINDVPTTGISLEGFCALGMEKPDTLRLDIQIQGDLGPQRFSVPSRMVGWP